MLGRGQSMQKQLAKFSMLLNFKITLLKEKVIEKKMPL